jgi:hypothetical protein
MGWMKFESLTQEIGLIRNGFEQKKEQKNGSILIMSIVDVGPLKSPSDASIERPTLQSGSGESRGGAKPWQVSRP